MNSPKSICLTSIFLLAIALPVAAASPSLSPFGSRAPQIDLNNSYQPPKLYVADAKITSQTDQSITGSFTLQNEESYLINAQYRLEFMGPVPAATRQQYKLPDDTVILYSRSEATNVGALKPGENRLLTFTASWPNIPANNYTLRIQVLTSTGRALGWGDLPVVKSTPDPLFTYLYPGSLQIKEYPDFQQPLTGPNIFPNENFIINATAQNPATTAQTVTPQLTVYAFDPARQEQTPQVVNFPAVTIAAGKAVALSLPVKTAAKPQVYFAQLKLIAADKNSHSTIGEYRWVVRGAGADILVASPLGYDAAAKQLTIKITYAGPADAETKFTGAIHVAVTDGQGDLGSQTIPNLQFTDALGGGFATIPLNHQPAGEVSVTTSINDANQHTVYTQTQTYPVTSLSAIGSSRLPVNNILLGIGAIALIALAIIVSKKRQNKGKK